MIQASRVYSVSKNEVLGIIVINEKCINVTKKLNVGYVNLMIIACYTIKFIAVTLPTGVWLKQTNKQGTVMINYKMLEKDYTVYYSLFCVTLKISDIFVVVK